MNLFRLSLRVSLSTLFLFINTNSEAEEYELLNIGGYHDNIRPTKINEKGYSLGSGTRFVDGISSTFIIEPSGGGLTEVAGAGSCVGSNSSIPNVKNITNDNEIVGAHFGSTNVYGGVYYPYTKSGTVHSSKYGLDYPGFATTVKLSLPYFAFDKDNALGTCYPSNSTSSTLPYTTACGFIGGVFKFFNLSTYPGSAFTEKEFLGFSSSDSSFTQPRQIAFSMTTDGDVVGSAVKNYNQSSSSDSENQASAFSWTQAGGMVDLGTLGGKHSVAYDINSSKTIVGSADKFLKSVNANPQRAFVKTSSGSMTELAIADQLSSSANAINDAGAIVGNVSYSADFSQGFIRPAGSSTVVSLTSLLHPLFQFNALDTASDINNHGEIVGSVSSIWGYMARPLPSILKPFPFTGGRSTRSTADFLIWRPSTGTWYALRPKLTGTSLTITDTLVKQWGLPGDLPLFGTDFDGDQIDDLTVWRPSTGVWYSCLSSKEFDCTQGTSQQFGLPGDIPLVTDFDKDGKTDLVVFRRSLPAGGIIGRWYVKASSNGVITSQQWGLAEDYPVPGDYNGDGYSDFAVFRPSTATWFVLYGNQSSGSPLTFLSKQFGLPGDHPMPRDLDADGSTDIVVYRPSASVWYNCSSSKQFECFKSDGSLNSPHFAYGLPGDYPLNRNIMGGETVPYAIWRSVDPFYGNEGGWYSNIPASFLENVGDLSIRHWGLKSDIPAGVGIRDLLILTKQETKAR